MARGRRMRKSASEAGRIRPRWANPTVVRGGMSPRPAARGNVVPPALRRSLGFEDEFGAFGGGVVVERAEIFADAGAVGESHEVAQRGAGRGGVDVVGAAAGAYVV